jgi:hypothetical protein
LQSWATENTYDVTDILSLLDTVTFNKDSFDKFVEYNNNLDSIRKTQLTNLDKRFIAYE